MLFGSRNTSDSNKNTNEERRASSDPDEEFSKSPAKWSLGILNDKETDEVPGSVLLLSKVHERNEPLGLRHAEARTSASSIPYDYATSMRSGTSSHSRRRRRSAPEVKKTEDGKIILDPQPHDSPNDPLNWPSWRRDSALLSLGLYCMLGGGMTPILAAGFKDVASTYSVTTSRVALTTGLYMLGLGVGCVIMSPTAIKFGKRPVYLGSAILFILSSVWCALSPNYISLLIARIVQGIAVSPVECLPSATIAEIYFLHERAYRLGIYTLLLLGGKNLVPLVSAAIIQSLGWRWVFWIVAIIVGFCWVLLFLFVPETFWDRTPHARKHHHDSKKQSRLNLHSVLTARQADHPTSPAVQSADVDSTLVISPNAAPDNLQSRHVGFVENKVSVERNVDVEKEAEAAKASPQAPSAASRVETPVHSTNEDTTPATNPTSPLPPPTRPGPPQRNLSAISAISSTSSHRLPANPYTAHYSKAPPKSFVASLRPYSGRLTTGAWPLIALRPFILFAYPAVLWSSAIYALSVGWLIVLSESVSHIYASRDTYNFTSLQVGLVYISPFVGGILGTAVAGKVSDVVVRAMSRRNDGVYEPEFRLVMAVPIAICTSIGLMGFGWSAEERDAWIVPTIFFGIISFGCSLGSTTAITFCVDSYRQYAGEALVTLNFSKNVFHGFVFSLFFPHWLEASGAKKVFLVTGGIQLFFLLFSIPMYIYGKRARMWTVRKRMMERF